MPRYRRVNNNRNENNNNHNNALPPNVITMPMNLWTDPTFWQNENVDPDHMVVVNGRAIPNTTTLNELGLTVTQNSVYSDPGAYNIGNVSPLELPPAALPPTTAANRIHRSFAIPKKRKTARRRSHARTATRNNRFGFKKAFGAIQKGLKKLTGRSRRRRS